MAALTDPGTADGRVNLLFREKAFWTFSRGQRLGDLRRLIRDYGRAPTARIRCYPIGTHYQGGDYGADSIFRSPPDERTATRTSGCLDRKAVSTRLGRHRSKKGRRETVSRFFSPVSRRFHPTGSRKLPSSARVCSLGDFRLVSVHMSGAVNLETRRNAVSEPDGT